MGRRIFASQALTLLIMAPLQGQFMLPFRAALYTWLWTRLHLTVIGPPASHALANGAFGTLEPRPVPLNRDTLRRLHEKGSSHDLTLLPTRSVIFSSSLCVPVHHGDSRLGSMSRSSNSSMMSFTMHINLVVTEQPVVVSLRHPTQHVLVVMPSAEG